MGFESDSSQIIQSLSLHSNGTSQNKPSNPDIHLEIISDQTQTPLEDVSFVFSFFLPIHHHTTHPNKFHKHSTGCLTHALRFSYKPWRTFIPRRQKHSLFYNTPRWSQGLDRRSTRRPSRPRPLRPCRRTVTICLPTSHPAITMFITKNRYRRRARCHHSFARRPSIRRLHQQRNSYRGHYNDPPRARWRHNLHSKHRRLQIRPFQQRRPRAAQQSAQPSRRHRTATLCRGWNTLLFRSYRWKRYQRL